MNQVLATLLLVLTSSVYAKSPFIGAHGVDLSKNKTDEVLFSPLACEEYYGTARSEFMRIVNKVESKKNENLKNSFASTDYKCPPGYKIKCKKQKRTYRNLNNKYIEIVSYYYFPKNVSISVNKFYKHIHTDAEPCQKL